MTNKNDVSSAGIIVMTNKNDAKSAGIIVMQTRMMQGLLAL